MLPIKLQYKLFSFFCYSFLLALILYLPSAFAQQNNVNPINAQTMLQNIAKNIPSLIQMTTAIAYVMGMFFIFSGILKLKQYGESRTMMSSEQSLKGPLIYLAVGAFLLYLPTSVQVGISSFWTEPNPYGYLQQQDQWAEFINDCFLIVQFVGIVAFIRGLLTLAQLSGHGGQPGTFGKGMTYIVAGIFCINIYQFVQVIFVTLGIQ